MAYLKGNDRKQAVLFTQCIDELIPSGAEVRSVDELVSGLDISKLGFELGAGSHEGRPGYDPADLLRLYIYGYLNRIRTSRLLERECKRNVERLWLMRGLTPCFSQALPVVRPVLTG